MCTEPRKFCQHTQMYLCKTSKNHSQKIKKSAEFADGTFKINQKRTVLSKINPGAAKVASKSSKMRSRGGVRLEVCLKGAWSVLEGCLECAWSVLGVCLRCA